MSDTTIVRVAQLPGSGYPTLSSFLPPPMPTPGNLVGLYVLRGSVDEAAYNHADSDLPMLAVGDPQVNELGGVCSAGNCFDTQIAQMEDSTFIVVARVVDLTLSANNTLLVSNFINGSGNGTGDSLGFSKQTTPVIAAYGQINSTSVTSSGLNISSLTVGDWCVFAGRFFADPSIPDMAVSAHYYTGGALTSPGGNTHSTTRALSADRTLRVGGHYSQTLFQGSNEILLAAIYDTNLDTAALEAACAEYAAYLAVLTTP